MGIIQAIGAAFSAIGSFFSFQSKKQERFNAPDMTKNADAARDNKEREDITAEVEASNRAGKVSKAERDRYADD